MPVFVLLCLGTSASGLLLLINAVDTKPDGTFGCPLVMPALAAVASGNKRPRSEDRKTAPADDTDGLVMKPVGMDCFCTCHCHLVQV